ncbi:MAG: zinc ribbon domain-containing protein [Anaerolineae bacterium]|jgi:hypothetical protein
MAIWPDRRTWLRLWLVVSLLALWPVFAGQAISAQEGARPEDLRIQQMRVQVMPEFDDPRVLVMVQGRAMAYDYQYPVTITFRVPAGAQINQMATVNMDSAGATMEAYEARPDPEDSRWQLVSYELGGAHFFYEYYYDPIVGEREKAFTYLLSSYHPVDEVTVEIQEPKGAEAFRTMPEAVSSRVDETLRLAYHEIEVGALKAGEEASVVVNYTKSGMEPSLTWEQVMALQEGKRPPATTGSGGESPGSGMPSEIVIFVGSASLIFVGVFIGYRLRLSDAAGDGAGEGQPEAYCRMCGAGLKLEASYCHQCGTRAAEGTQSLGQAKPATVGSGRERR